MTLSAALSRCMRSSKRTLESNKNYFLCSIDLPDVVLAINTSSYLLTDICRGVQRRERVLGIHFITPAHVVRAVELIYADYTPSALVEWGRKFLDTIDHVGVACKERPGFLVNRLQYRYLPKYVAFWTRELPAGMTLIRLRV